MDINKEKKILALKDEVLKAFFFSQASQEAESIIELFFKLLIDTEKKGDTLSPFESLNLKWDTYGSLLSILRSAQDERKLHKLYKMNEAHRPKKNPDDYFIHTLKCMDESDVSNLSFYDMMLANPDHTTLDLNEIKEKKRKLEEKIKKRYQRAIKLEEKRSEPVSASDFLFQLQRSLVE